MESSLTKAFRLYELHKYALAIKEADLCLSQDPGNARAYAVKSLAYMGKKEASDALENAQKAVSLSPDDDFHHYVLSLVYLNLTKDNKKAEAAIRDALRLNPENADYYDVLAQLRMVQRDYVDALKLVDKGLELDPQNVDCLSTRARVLTKMGKKSDASQDLEEALKSNPENPQALASAGWVRLENGDYKGALEAFRDSLKLKPDFEYARDGLIQALKARNFLFRQYLRYAFWLNRLGSRARWALLIGIVILVRFISHIPGLAPVAALYLLFVLSTWLIDPIFNLFLRFDKYGKYALTKSEILASNLIVSAMLLAVAVAVTAFLLDFPELYVGAGALFLMVIPISGTASAYENNRNKFRRSLVFSIILGLLLVSGFAILPLAHTTGMVLSGIVILGAMIFTWFSAIGS